MGRRSARNCPFCFTEALEMNDLPCPQETDGVGHFRHVLDHPQDVVVSAPGFLFRSEVFE